MHSLLKNKAEALKQLCNSLKVKSLYSFGSATTGEFTETSDLDFLISFEDDISIEDYTNNYFQLHYKLRELFNRDIDLITDRAVKNPYFIKSLEKSKQLIYEA